MGSSPEFYLLFFKREIPFLRGKGEKEGRKDVRRASPSDKATYNTNPFRTDWKTNRTSEKKRQPVPHQKTKLSKVKNAL